ncbi:response regulator transcription factor [Kibdelosporangium philippinense]|uniref:Response regulator transcription factor n=1 Tax=Kibdelosporangium philippinense TaxID=211113 RepID=A0ABS8ZEG3_9PSEU|nr:response regulator transcription factor [Kibdelosporangium philippinense]MCE7005942.1 response regulator transcription factor [Kibdelosporangium philippinense]
MQHTGDGQHLLVVDDEPGITELLSTTLNLAGYRVSTVGSGHAALNAVEAERPDMVILDVMLPDMDGFTVCRRLNERGHAPPVLFLTARGSVEDTVTGLRIGGDDYVTKPFHVVELLARVQALLRRSGNGVGEPVLRCADLVLDETKFQAVRDDEALDLTPTEYKLLRYLMVNAGQVMTKEQILQHVWQHEFGEGVVEKLVSRLRHKVDAGRRPLIHTVRGFGYRIAEA